MRHDKRAHHLFDALLSMLLMFAVLPGTSTSAVDAAGTAVKQQANPYADAELAIRIIPAANNTFGYDILLNGRPFIHQPNVPGLPGNEGFKTGEGARKVAELVVEKIRKGVMPPSVSVEELKCLGVLE